MPTEGAARAKRSRIHWNRTLVIQVAALLLLPVVLGFVLGWYDLNPVFAERFTPVGNYAHDYLSGFPDNRLVVEVDYQTSVGPPPTSVLTLLGTRINQTCDKGSVVFEEFPFSSGASSWAESDLLGLEASVRHTWPSAGTMALDYLYLGGSDSSDSGAIGIAYRGSSIAVFEGTIASNSPSSGIGQVLATVFIHEFGHELGLVGIVGSAPNADPNHPYHSNDPNGVMYWAVDSTALLLGILGGPAPPTQFNAADMSDLGSVRSTPILLTEVVPWGVLGASILVAMVIVIRRRRSQSESSEGP
jgi:hypothetical protein